jgi:peptide/nickel transport system permease protein
MAGISWYLARRLLRLLGMLLLLSLLVFLMARLSPGDPLRSWYGDGVERMSGAEKAVMSHKLGLDRSLPVQYGIWLRGALTGDLGISLRYKQPVTTVMGNVLLNTVALGVLSYVLTFLIAFRMGQKSALSEGSLRDRWLTRWSITVGSIPSFFLALLLILILAVQLPLFPTGGAYSYGLKYSLPDRLWHLVMPTAVIVLGHVGYYGLMVRNLLAEETRKDYVLLLKSQGVPKKEIVNRCCTRNILSTMIPAMSMAVPHLLGGTYVVEMVFGYPGLGTLTFESALYKDYNLLMAITLLTGAVVIVCNFLGEILSARVDPRMREQRNPIAKGNRVPERTVAGNRVTSICAAEEALTQIAESSEREVAR